MIATLAGLIFPERTRSGTLTGQDRSDLLHIATAIHHRVAGFITGERAILRAREELNQLYSIDVVGAAEFVETLEPGEVGPTSLCATPDGFTIRVANVSDENAALVKDFLTRNRISRQAANTGFREGCPDILLRVRKSFTKAAFSSDTFATRMVNPSGVAHREVGQLHQVPTSLRTRPRQRHQSSKAGSIPRVPARSPAPL